MFGSDTVFGAGTVIEGKPGEHQHGMPCNGAEGQGTGQPQRGVSPGRKCFQTCPLGLQQSNESGLIGLGKQSASIRQPQTPTAMNASA